ncbi:MAG: gliding motility-associated C-terminal domain-containing protein [Saprospiraceae bacterium]
MAQYLTFWIFSMLFCNTQWRGGPISNAKLNISEPASACNILVNAGQDDTICEPGAHIYLDGSITGNSVLYEWTPHTGLSNPFILNPSADIGEPITYTLTAWGFDPGFQNLVYNHDFNLGNTGFFTAYTYVMDQPVIQNELYTQGTYTVINDPLLVNDTWADCNPSPVSGGNMLVINGVAPLDTFWCQTINVNTNTQYQFDGWYVYLAPGLLDLMFSFNGELSPVIWYGGNPCMWGSFDYPPYTTWFSGDTTSVEICVLCANFGGGQWPVDVAFDDFSLVELCPVSDSVSIYLTDDVAPVPDIMGPADVCKESIGTYTANFPPGTEILSYVWSVSPGGVITAGQGTEQVSVLWHNTGVANVCLTINTFCHSNNACFTLDVNDIPPDVQITGPVFLCPGESATLIVPITLSGNEFQWNVPTGIDITGGQGSNTLGIQWGNLQEATVCVDITNECGTSSACIDITRFPGYITNLDLVLCEGDVIVVNGNEYGNGILSGTEYFITNNGCDSLVEIQITQEFPIEHMVTTILCPGDSVFLQGAYQTQPGIYIDSFATTHVCDSFVITQLIVSLSDSISVQSTTCDSAAAGVYITFLNNPIGCDTVVTTTITFITTDTTIINLSSCSISAAGTTTHTFINQGGCDSLVITHTNWIAPADTTFLSGISCDSSQIGIFQTWLSTMTGCDSLLITTITSAVPDTTVLFTTSCDSSTLGISEMHFISQSGCDSIVFTTITYSAQDSTFIIDTSCDPGDVGVFIQSYINHFGCDSIVTMNVTLEPFDQSFITSTTCDPAAAGVFVQTYTNQSGCDSIVTETIDLLASSQTFLFSTTCTSSQAGTFITTLSNQNGCDSIVMLTVSLIPADTTIISFRTCDPTLVGNPQNTFTNQDGCDSLVIEQTTLYPLPDLQLQINSDFNGSDISCYGEADGSAIAIVTGVSPFSYIWSTGSTAQSTTDLIAGSYTVTITDGNGCKTDGEIALFDPGPFTISFIVSRPDCFDQKNGSITVEPSGGVSPILYSMDGINYQASSSFTDLGGGSYQFTAMDANGCEVKEIILINAPLQVNVELGDDQIIESGDTAMIHAKVNVPFDSLASIIWTGIVNPDCPTCLTQSVIPIITSTYTVQVTSVDGCSDEDALTIFLDKKTDVYVPNIFSPNGDNINDKLIISAGSDVEEISTLIIFDRWGNIVYAVDHVTPNDLNYAWDGKLKGRALNSGVFAYKLIVVLKDGAQVIRVGDVTLLR